MNTLRALLYFDFSRCRLWVVLWWLCCFVQAVAGVMLVVKGGEPLGGQYVGVSVTLIYVILLILIGLLFRSSHPGLRESFFGARPVTPTQVLASRWCFVALILLLPHFLAQVAPLLWVDPSFAAVSAFAVYYWSVHLGVVAVLSALAAGSRKISSYMLRAIFAGAALLAVAAIMKRFSLHESNWIYVQAPEVGRLLWEAGICALSVLFFVGITAALYRGRASWRLLVSGILAAVLLAAAWKPIAFWTDASAVGHELPSERLEMSELSFEAERSWNGYDIQRNRGPGSLTVGGQSAPPYWNDGEEAFWFIKGKFEVGGLDPELAYSARLLDARWVSPEGAVVDYDPPEGTFSIRNLKHSLPPPVVTTARLETLLGEPPMRPQYFVPNTGKTDVLLFGAWTSTYERFKTAPGRLELRVRVNVYSHEIGQRLPLGGGKTSGVSAKTFRFQGTVYTDEELEVQLNVFAPTKSWGMPIEERWNGGRWNWILYDPETGQRGPSSGQSFSGSGVWQSLYERRLGIEFRSNEASWIIPDLSRPESLELLYIQPRYLGSAEVDVVVDDFPLVTQQSIEQADR